MSHDSYAVMDFNNVPPENASLDGEENRDREPDVMDGVLYRLGLPFGAGANDARKDTNPTLGLVALDNGQGNVEFNRLPQTIAILSSHQLSVGYVRTWRINVGANFFRMLLGIEYPVRNPVQGFCNEGF